jgi:endonuclease III
MMCSSKTGDEQLVAVLGQLFSEFEFTLHFVLEKYYPADPNFWVERLKCLGCQNNNAKNLILAARSTISLERVPRSYAKIVEHYKGAGPKVALVTVHSSYNDVVSFFLALFA